MIERIGLTSGNGAAVRTFTSMMKGNFMKMQVRVLPRDSAPVRQASEIDYAASMHFSAAYLPSGSSSSLDAEQRSSETTPTPTSSSATASHWSPSRH